MHMGRVDSRGIIHLCLHLYYVKALISLQKWGYWTRKQRNIDALSSEIILFYLKCLRLLAMQNSRFFKELIRYKANILVLEYIDTYVIYFIVPSKGRTPGFF